MIGVSGAYVASGDVYEFKTETALAANQVLKFGNIIGYTRRPFEVGEIAVISLIGIDNLLVSEGLTAELGAPAYFDIETQKLVASGGLLIGIYFDPVQAGDEFASVKFMPQIVIETTEPTEPETP